MRGRTSLLLLGLLAGLPAQAAKSYSLTPFAGYLLGPRVTTDDSVVRLRDSRDVGLRLDLPHGDHTRWRLEYFRSGTRLERRERATRSLQESIPIDAAYYQLGGIAYLGEGRSRGFVSSTVGLVHYSPRLSAISSETLLSMTLGLGAQFRFSRHLGLEVQGRLLLPFEAYGGSLFCGPDGCRMELRGESALLHSDFTAGLRLDF